jgi:hypothetical protein
MREAHPGFNEIRETNGEIRLARDWLTADSYKRDWRDKRER